MFTNFTTEIVSGVYEDEKGSIWTVSSKGTLNRYDEQSLVSKKPSPVEILKGKGMFFRIIEDEEGNIWVGTLNGLLKYDWNSMYFLKTPNEG